MALRAIPLPPGSRLDCSRLDRADEPILFSFDAADNLAVGTVAGNQR